MALADSAGLGLKQTAEYAGSALVRDKKLTHTSAEIHAARTRTHPACLTDVCLTRCYHVHTVTSGQAGRAICGKYRPVIPEPRHIARRFGADAGPAGGSSR